MHAYHTHNYQSENSMISVLGSKAIFVHRRVTSSRGKFATNAQSLKKLTAVWWAD
jgi:hypothetical protein